MLLQYLVYGFARQRRDLSVDGLHAQKWTIYILFPHPRMRDFIRGPTSARIQLECKSRSAFFYANDSSFTIDMVTDLMQNQKKNDFL